MGRVWQVGAPIDPNDESVAAPSFGWHPNANNLLLDVLDDPTPGELAAHRAGTATTRVALIDRAPLLVLLVNFGPGGQREAPWVWIEGGPPPPVLQPGPDGRVVFTDVAVDLTAGVVASVRLVTASRHFTRRLTVALSSARDHGPKDPAAAVALINSYQAATPDWRATWDRASATSKLG